MCRKLSVPKSVSCLSLLLYISMYIICVCLLRGRITHRKFHHHNTHKLQETVISTEFCPTWGEKYNVTFYFQGSKFRWVRPLYHARSQPDPDLDRLSRKDSASSVATNKQKSSNRILAIFVKFSSGAHACGWQHWVYWSFLGDECCMLDRSVRREAAALSRS